MADMFDSLKKTWLKGMEAVSNTASNIASNTKQKVSEINLDNRRREILSDFGLIAYELWQKGMELPKELNDLMVELGQVDEELNTLRAQKFNNTVVPQEEEVPQEDESECPHIEQGQEETQEETEAEEVPSTDDTNA